MYQELRDELESIPRLSALQSTHLMDSPPEESFDRLTRLAARILKVPVALVSLVDDHRQFFLSPSSTITDSSSRVASGCLRPGPSVVKRLYRTLSANMSFTRDCRSS